jgi:hypothetical protein
MCKEAAKCKFYLEIYEYYISITYSYHLYTYN